MLKLYFGVARANFLSLTLVCICLAASYGWLMTGQLVWPELALVLAVALAAHISVNALNEYFDFRSGLDYLTEKTPFSGGSGTLLKYPDQAWQALVVGLVTLALVILGGLGLIAIQGWQLLWIGLPGVVIIYAYTQHINRSPLLCLLAPGVGFGLLMTLGASWVFSDQLDAGSWSLAVITALLVSNLLLLNQFPDVEADRQVGRCNYPILWGRRVSAWIFSGLLAVSYLVLVVAVWQQWLAVTSLLGLISLPLALVLMRGVILRADDLKALVPFMGLNILLCHLYPLLLAGGLVWAGN
ncbi:prenyltransferase [Marinospirillum perlucidum]|uniref:prenyltransferase n=1 Tax=Marinospirillum perlucidum TaxID=1982602 RepID=UPI000DF33A1B|nr:prenyltransferase [Marinospirillum perlucidum]